MGGEAGNKLIGKSGFTEVDLAFGYNPIDAGSLMK